MLTKRIIPCLDVDDGRVVKGISFVDIRDAGDPAELALFYDAEGADELVFLDITASSDERDIMLNVVKDVSEQVFIPLTVGGGMRGVSDVHKMLEAGADKVSLNTAVVEDPKIILESADYFGSQAIVVAIDAKRFRHETPLKRAKCHDLSLQLDESSQWQVYIHGGRTATGLDALKWALRVTELGAGELLVTSMDTDGHQTGFDLNMIKTISTNVSIPVIASGGAGEPDHFLQAVISGEADAVLAASIFHFGIYSVNDVKNYLSSYGVSIRPMEHIRDVNEST